LDFGVYANQSGHHIIELIKQDDKQIFYIKKK
jgi:tRNA 2-thiouridine synthesizing protein A